MSGPLGERRLSGRRRQPIIVLDGIVGGIELGKLLSLADQINRVEFLLARFDLTMHKTTETLGHVSDPAGLAEFAVADDVDPRLGLLAHDVGHLLPQGLSNPASS